MTPEFTKERDALRATNRQLAEANATLTADLKEARALNTQLAWFSPACQGPAGQLPMFGGGK